MMNNYVERYYYTPADLGIGLDDLLAVTDRDSMDTDLVNLILKKYRFDWIIYQDVEVNPWETPSRPDMPDWTVEWLNKFDYIYKSTKDRYKAILKSYNIKKDSLLDKIGSKVTTRFNDTPQDGGDFASDAYTSNISTNVSEVDHKDAMGRLSEIYTLYQNVLKDWVDEFRPIFN